MSLEDRVERLKDRTKALEDRLRVLEYDEIFHYRRLLDWADKITEHMDEQTSGVIKVSLGNIQTMKNIVNDLQEHFESHGLDKKKREEHASKRKSKY